MNCPFCKNHIDQHEVNRCADVWLATLFCKEPHIMFSDRAAREDDYVTIPFTTDKAQIKMAGMYYRTQSLILGSRKGEPLPKYATDLNVFMAEVMPKLHEAFEDIEIGYDAERGKWVFYDAAWGAIGEGKTIDKALFRAAVKVLSK